MTPDELAEKVGAISNQYALRYEGHLHLRQAAVVLNELEPLLDAAAMALDYMDPAADAWGALRAARETILSELIGDQ